MRILQVTHMNPGSMIGLQPRKVQYNVVTLECEHWYCPSLFDL